MVILYNVIRHNVTIYNVIRYYAIIYNVIRYYIIVYNAIHHSVKIYNVIRYYVVYNVIRYYAILYNVIRYVVSRTKRLRYRPNRKQCRESRGIVRYINVSSVLSNEQFRGKGLRDPGHGRFRDTCAIGREKTMRC